MGIQREPSLPHGKSPVNFRHGLRIGYFNWASILAASAGSGCAPIIRSTIVPFFTITRVGIDLASYSAADFGLSSTLIFTTLSEPAYLAANFSNTGATIRHGPHHGAHRSINTNLLVSNAAARDVSVASAIQGSDFLQLPQVGVPELITGTRFLVPQDGQAVTRDSEDITPP